MKKPFLTIITINYNDAEGLSKTMNSVFEQRYSNFEFLIIDGGSTDQSVQYIQKNEDKITYWVSEEDRGVFHAQNKGIMAARGEFLLFLNSGDVLTNPEALHDFITHSEFEGDIIYGDYKFEEGEKIYPNELTPYFFMRTSLPHQSTLFRKTVFDRMGLYDEKYRIAADRAFYIKCFMSGLLRFKHITYTLTLFDLSGVSNDPALLQEKKVEDEAVFKEYFGNHYEELAKRRASERKLKQDERNSFTGILKRIKRRLTS